MITWAEKRILLLCVIYLNLVNSIFSSLANYEKKEIKMGKQAYIEINGICTEITIPNSFKRAVIKMTEISSNVQQILVTDKPISGCMNNDLYKCCDLESKICFVSNRLNSNSFWEFSINYCVESIYLYTCIDEKINKPGEFNIKSSIINNEPCSTLEFSSFSECSNISLENCQDSRECNEKCVYANCVNSETGEAILSMCVPSNLTDKSIKEKCLSMSAFKSETPKLVKVPCPHKTNISESRQNSSNSFLKLLGIIIGLSILITVIASMYYRYKISIENTPPFDPPSFCPEIVFPRGMLN